MSRLEVVPDCVAVTQEPRGKLHDACARDDVAMRIDGDLQVETVNQTVAQVSLAVAPGLPVLVVCRLVAAGFGYLA